LSFQTLQTTSKTSSTLKGQQHRSSKINNANYKSSSKYIQLNSSHPLLNLQQTAGNRAVQRLLSSNAPSNYLYHPYNLNNVIQLKLKIGQSGDVYEHEADRVAEQVTRMSSIATSSPPFMVQSNITNNMDQRKVRRKCSSCKKMKDKGEEEELKISRKTLNVTSLETTDKLADEISHVCARAGSPLDCSTKEFMESRFSYDFSKVRIHTDKRATGSAKSVNALAYTIGNDIVFGEGQYQPNTLTGRRLLAHELTHVVQQDGINSSIESYTPIIQRDILDDLSETAGEAWKDVKETAGEAWESAKSVAGEAWESAKSVAGEAWESAKSVAGEDEQEFESKRAQLLSQISRVQQLLSGHDVLFLTSEEYASLSSIVATIREKLSGYTKLPDIKVVRDETSPMTAAVVTPISSSSIVGILQAIAIVVVGIILAGGLAEAAPLIALVIIVMAFVYALYLLLMRILAKPITTTVPKTKVKRKTRECRTEAEPCPFIMPIAWPRELPEPTESPRTLKRQKTEDLPAEGIDRGPVQREFRKLINHNREKHIPPPNPCFDGEDEDFMPYEAHHIHPLFLGGGDEVFNLCSLLDTKHRSGHIRLNDQSKFIEEYRDCGICSRFLTRHPRDQRYEIVEKK
jgi:uncharacterized protein DUF4157